MSGSKERERGLSGMDSIADSLRRLGEEMDRREAAQIAVIEKARRENKWQPIEVNTLASGAIPCKVKPLTPVRHFDRFGQGFTDGLFDISIEVPAGANAIILDEGKASDRNGQEVDCIKVQYTYEGVTRRINIPRGKARGKSGNEMIFLDYQTHVEGMELNV